MISAIKDLLHMKGRVDTSCCHKKDQTREPYDRAKIERGVFRSCHKLPISVDDMNLLVDKVETEIFNKEINEVPSSLIGELVMEGLEKLNAVAYVRFASIYREFKDVDTFMEELKKFLINKITACKYQSVLII